MRGSARLVRPARRAGTAGAWLRHPGSPPPRAEPGNSHHSGRGGLAGKVTCDLRGDQRAVGIVRPVREKITRDRSCEEPEPTHESRQRPQSFPRTRALVTLIPRGPTRTTSTSARATTPSPAYVWDVAECPGERGDRAQGSIQPARQHRARVSNGSDPA